MASMQHQVQGEYIYDGLLLFEGTRPSELESVADMDLAGDTVVVSYPKTGTNWTKQLVWLIHHDANTAAADQTPLRIRAKFMEFSTPGYTHANKRNITLISEEPHPRTIHTHLPTRYFSTQLAASTKFVVVVRNPKDTLVSYYHFYQSNSMLGNFAGTWDEFFELAKQKHLVYGDFCDWYMDWYKHRENPNVMFVKFEDMKQDLESVVRRLSTFLETSLDDEQITSIAQYCSFDTMKQNTRANYKSSSFIDANVSPFMRKGAVGDWKNYFSQEQSDYIDKKYNDTLREVGLLLNFE